MASSGRQVWRRSQVSKELYETRERLARMDKYLAKLYRWNANLNHKINRVQRERQKLMQRIEGLEVREGVK